MTHDVRFSTRAKWRFAWPFDLCVPHSKPGTANVVIRGNVENRERDFNATLIHLHGRKRIGL